MCLELLHFQSNVNDGRKNVSSKLSIPSSIREAIDWKLLTVEYTRGYISRKYRRKSKI